MKNSLAVVLLLTICGFSNSANSQLARLNFLCNFSFDTAHLFSEVTNTFADTNQFVVFGTTLTKDATSLRGFHAGYDYSGNLKWVHNIDFPGPFNSTGGYDVLIKSNHNYVIGGTVVDYHINPHVNVTYPYLYVIDQNGDSVFANVFTDSVVSTQFSAITTDDQNNIIAGGEITGNTITLSANGNSYDSGSTWLVKFDHLGNKIWEKKFFTASLKVTTSSVNKVCITSDKAHYLFAGDCPNKDYQGALYPTVTKTDSSGNLIWSKALPCGYNAFNALTYDVDIAPDKSGGCYFVSSYSVYPYLDTGGGLQFYYLLLGQLDINGDTVWTRKFTRNINWMSLSNRIALYPDGNLILSGIADGSDETSGASYDHPILIKADTMGNILWYREKERIHHFHPVQRLSTLSIAPNGSILQAGYIQTIVALPDVYDTAGLLSWIVVSDSSGLSCDADTFLDTPVVSSTSIIGNHLSASAFKIFPNPVTDDLNITQTGKPSQSVTIQLFDLTGRVLLSKQLILTDRPSHISLQTLPPGPYLYRITPITGDPSSGSILKE